MTSRKSSRESSAPSRLNFESPGQPERNRLLAALPHESYARLLPSLVNREMAVHDVLWEPDQPIENAYFPRSFVASVLIPFKSQRARIEAATVGREGFMGTPLVLGVPSSSSLAIAQVKGDGAVITAGALLAACEDDRVILRMCLRYAQSLQEQTAHSVACLSQHSLDERCARWLLMTHDRVGRDEFTLLQQFLASMLGVHRPRVTVAAGMLQQAGLISYSRGVIRIIDRAGLEAASCECYAVIRDAHERAFAAHVAA